jgi:YD repeat-containing protein
MVGARLVRRLGCAFVLAGLVAWGLSSWAYAGSVTYGYDALGRLISVTNSNGVTTTYTYDAAGNRTQQVVNVTKPFAGMVNATVNGNSSNNSIPPNLTGAAATGLSISTGPAHGSASTSGLSLIYTPATNYVGQDTFQYTASNANGSSDPATVFVTVNAASPFAGAVSVTINENSANTAVPLNITGPTPTGVTVAQLPAHGNAVQSGTTITYTPNTGYVGSDSFTYTASNGPWTSQTATVSVTVVPILPIAGGITQSVAANSQYNPINTTNMNLTSVIGGGTPTALQVATAPGHGTVTVSGLVMRYTPANGYSGPDSFIYTASNGAGASAAATVNITVAFGIGIWCPAANPNLVVPGCFAWASGVLW